MRNTKESPDADQAARQLAKLAEMLRLEIAEEQLAALATQLRRIDELEHSALRDVPPILKMDADWHD